MTERIIWQSPWVEEEQHNGEVLLTARRIIFYEEEVGDVKEWQNEDGWYLGHFVIDDVGCKELDGSNEEWDTGDMGVHWSTEELRAQGWFYYAEYWMTEECKGDEEE